MGRGYFPLNYDTRKYVRYAFKKCRLQVAHDSQDPCCITIHLVWQKISKILQHYKTQTTKILNYS